MPLLLHIDTATEHASICLSQDEKVVGLEESSDQKNHASFVQTAIQKLLDRSGFVLSAVDAISVSAGPGSYTGLRVGLASAKGICYALNKPLILLHTLQVLAQSVKEKAALLGEKTVICPMIDARRMEVFTAMYNSDLAEKQAAHALILTESSFADELKSAQVLFCGSGQAKCRQVLTPAAGAHFTDQQHTAADMVPLALQKFQQQQFADLAYSEPFYVKEFFTPARKA